ncbi:hypothetical protein FOA52_013694 [Chlamydomonas sp. UWO 241]|nr:hypothetical protein FOA52_013694 [Chlamydomonas sp. UWO 241]
MTSLRCSHSALATSRASAARVAVAPRPYLTPARSTQPRFVAVASSAQPSGSASSSATAEKKKYTCALLFDCDGVIVETEELHRLAYNSAFAEFECTIDGKPLEWTVEYYDILQNTVGGGKPKMKYHFANNGWPASKVGVAPSDVAAQDKLVDDLQDCKTFHYKIIVEKVAQARPGVLELMDEGLARDDIAMCICSAATKAGFEKVVNSVVGKDCLESFDVVNSVVGKDRLARFDVILAGDDVTKKKPNPLIYNMARERLGLSADRCIVIEDSMVGLRAAVGAHMACIITPTLSTASADFKGEGAIAVVPVLMGSNYQVKIDDLFAQNKGGETVPDIRIKM